MTETLTRFTTDEILTALEDHLESGEGWYEFTTNERKPDGGWDYKPLSLTLDGTAYDVKEVDRTGGMDEGSNASVTIQVGSQFFRKSGYYASHYGYDWDGDFAEVHAVTKTVTVYE